MKSSCSDVGKGVGRERNLETNESFFLFYYCSVASLLESLACIASSNWVYSFFFFF